MEIYSDSIIFQETSSLVRQSSHSAAQSKGSVTRKEIFRNSHLHKESVNKWYDMVRSNSFKLLFDLSKFITLMCLRLLVQILTEKCVF
jgi:hypothetical protein